MSDTVKRQKPATIFGVPRHLMMPRILIITSTILLCLIGLVMIYSASSIVALKEIGDPAYYLKRQLVFLSMGVVGAVIAGTISYRLWITPLAWAFWLITLGMLIATFFIGSVGGGAQRWLEVGGVRLQPSEFSKITILLVIAATFAHQQAGRLEGRKLIVILAIGALVPVAFILIEDMGSAMIILAMLMVLLILAGIPLRALGLVILAVAIVGVVFIAIEPYRLVRVRAVLDPWSDPLNEGYQSIQGFYALGSGGLFGVGIGNSTQKFLYLPVAYSDFILAIIGEETGLLGTAIVVLLFGLLVFSGFRIAYHAPDLHGTLIAGGATALLGVQAILNMLSVIGLFPITGKPLPFVSYGGSSIMVSLVLVGLIVAVSRGSDVMSREEHRRDALTVIGGGGNEPRTSKQSGRGGRSTGTGPARSRSQSTNRSARSSSTHTDRRDRRR